MNTSLFKGKTIVITIVVAIAALIIIFYVLNTYIYNEKQAYTAESPKDAEYTIEGLTVRLKDGKAERETVAGAASKITTEYFGNDLKVDLNNDGREDVVFLLTQKTGGSGVFYYVAAALNTDRGYLGSEVFYLGDRIAPQKIEKGNGQIIVINYADRFEGESFSVAPSLAKSIWLRLDPETRQFGQVEQNFEGEADPSKMSLGMKTWIWNTNNVFTLTFAQNGKFTATTDCNSMGGSYVVKDQSLTFSQIFSTKKFCEGSKEGDFAKLLENTETFRFMSNGELVLGLKGYAGQAVFR